MGGSIKNIDNIDTKYLTAAANTLKKKHTN